MLRDARPFDHTTTTTSSVQALGGDVLVDATRIRRASLGHTTSEPTVREFAHVLDGVRARPARR